jgi:hypothetical protein
MHHTRTTREQKMTERTKAATAMDILYKVSSVVQGMIAAERQSDEGII